MRKILFLLGIGLFATGIYTLGSILKYHFFIKSIEIDDLLNGALLAIILFGFIPIALSLALLKLRKYLNEKEREREKLKEKKDDAYKQQAINEWKIRFPKYWESIANEKLELGMTLEMISIFLAKRGMTTKKEIVTKDTRIENHYFGGYWSSSKRDYVYSWEVTLEKGEVVGWRKL